MSFGYFFFLLSKFVLAQKRCVGEKTMEVKIMCWKSLGMEPLEKLPTFRDNFIPILEISNTYINIILFTVIPLCFHGPPRKQGRRVRRWWVRDLFPV